MRLPTSQEIVALYGQYHTPALIQDHMTMVGAIAAELACYHPVSPDLVVAAAKLHDLVRIPEQWPYVPKHIPTPQPHAEINYQLLVAVFPEVAVIIRPHSLMTILNERSLPSLEAKLIYYADKRVNNSDIVSLVDRLNLGQDRWHVKPEQDRRSDLLPKLLQLEQELFSPIPYDPAELKNHLTSQT